MILRHWTTTLLLLAILAALIGGVQSAAAQPEPPAVPEQPSRLLLPLTMNNASSADATPVQPQTEPQVVFEIRASETNATITTDQPDYPPGAVVTIMGAGWAAGEIVHIDVNDSVGQSWSYSSTPDVVVRDDGTFTHQFKLPDWFVANYGVVATGQTSGWASTTFTDLSIGTYDQCSNDKVTGYTSGDNGCRWINGNLQSNNSIYFEGDATVQRVWLTDLPPGSTHTVSLKYGTTKGGKHAYDFLTTWDWSEDWITSSDRCQGITGCDSAIAETKWDIPEDPNVPASFEPNALGERQFVMRGGTLTGATTPAVVSGSYSGDSETIITVSFTVGPAAGSMCSTKQDVTTCGVALWFGAHVAAQANWGLGLGAGSISGSPYHVALDAIDGASVGQRDNQMQAGVVTEIPNGTIVVVKDAVPNDAQDFGFSLTNNTTINQSFSLDDDNDATLPSSQTFSVPPGTWTATELLPLPGGWSLTNLVCVDPTSNSTVNLATGAATINLASNETVTCTYTNSKGSHIIVKKVTSGGDGSFEFDPSWSAANFFLSNDQTNDSGALAAGTYSVAEVNIPSTWSLTGASCDDGSPVTAISLQTGETVTCTFNNTRTYNQDLTVRKTAVPAFSRTYKWLIDKSVDDTRIEIAEGGTATFNYSVKVTPDGYTDSSWAVKGEITVHNPNTFDVAGVNITDAIDNGGTCTVVDGSNLTVPAGGDLVRAYSCTYTGALSTPPAGTNKATATWDAATYNTSSGSAVGTAAVGFATATYLETNKTITVVDDKTDPANLAILGTWKWGDGEHIFTYALGKQGEAGKCIDYTNTAKIGETGQSDSQKVTVCVGKDLAVSKTAAGKFDGTYLWKVSKDVDQTLVKIAEGGSYTFHYTVVVEQAGVSAAGWTLSGKITLTNPNDWEDVTVSSLTDAVNNGGTCTVDPGPYKVPAGKTLDVNYTCAYATAPSSYSGTNTVTAVWDKAAAFTPGDSASGSAPFTLTQAGATNKTVNVTDSYGGNLGTVTATDNAPFAVGTFTYDRTVSGIAGKCTSYDNTAKITETGQSASKSVTLCVGKDLTLTKTAAGSFNRTYLWQITKDVDQTLVKLANGNSYTFHYAVAVAQAGVIDAGWVLKGKITLTNPNDWEDITLTSLSDVVSNGGACTVDPGPYKVLAGKTLDVAYTCSYSTLPSSYSGTNTATANWDAAAAFTPGGSTSGSAAFTLAQSAATNKIAHVTDTVGGNLGTVTATDVEPYSSGTFTYSRTVSGVAGKCTIYDNTATITETGQSASKSVTVCVGKDLTLTKTAAGTFDRTYLWKISKNVDKTLMKIADGDSYTFHYTVDVEQMGVTDAGWTIAGKITVSNPNDWEDITLASLADMVDNGGTCTVAPGPYVVPKSGSLEVGYSCSYASAPSSYSGTNTATANWDAATYFTPSGLAHGTAGFTLAQADATNKTVSVTDSFNGNLGTVSATDSTPFAKASFTYDRAASGVAGKCTTYDNTATITETGQSADKSVTLCVGKSLTVSKTAVPSFTRT